MKADTKRKPGRPKGTHQPPRFTEWLRLRISPEQLKAVQGAANDSGQDLSAFVRGVLPGGSK